MMLDVAKWLVKHVVQLRGCAQQRRGHLRPAMSCGCLPRGACVSEVIAQGSPESAYRGDAEQDSHQLQVPP